MMRSSRLLGAGLLLALLTSPATSPAQGAFIVAGITNLTGMAIQDITLLPGTPFNPGPTSIFLPGVQGFGNISLQRNEQVGTTITVATLTGGQYYGTHPLLGDFVFGNILPLTGADFTSRIDNVVQNPADPGFASGQASSFQSGDFFLGGASFGFEFLSNGQSTGIKLFTDPAVPFGFTSHFDGLPPSWGTVLTSTGPDVLNVLFNGVAVAQSSNRRIVLTPTPEPSSLVLSALGCVLILGVTRRMRR